ncbi:Flp family type IVb pilin [Mesorhizobium waimense]|uniref:Flp family type IVb pilin n=1 Tax=Mesorhizobium waimense TaxID=1300307 RepID=A0A3A5JYX4_9HYPH|nr:Flp family type IVb pilin [Mesorhizobium waimense]RJT27355.1 Flp family type IVb pilin [Mesorhizobium waimense]
MTKLLSLTKAFRDEESGAAMVEYSILIGIIAVASIMVVIAIGAWVSGRFTDLCTGLDAHPTGTCSAAGGS